MGKSPGRWIKTVLFGKKHSKSNLSKNVIPDHKVCANAPVEDPAGNSPVILDPYQFTDKGVENVELEKGTSGTSCGSLPRNQGPDSQSNIVSVPVSDAETRRQDEAATKTQAVFRGYLARRAFRALKGIIRLQALIRGHLVRRQAVATLRCMQAIVKLQAVARGRRVRVSDTGPGARKMYNLGELQVDIGANSIFLSEKLATNTYVRKLLSLPTSMPLSLQYEPVEPNSAWNWLERWSLSRFWEPPARPKKVLNVMPQRKQNGSHILEREAGKSKRTIRKASSAANGDNGALASFEMDKPKQSSRKITNHQTELVQEQPRHELERVKCNLRKVSASAAVASDKSETETEKPLQELSAKTILNSAASNVSEQEMVISAENPVGSDGLVDKLASIEATNELVDVPYNDHLLVEIHSPEVDENADSTPLFQEESGSKMDESGKENQKIRKRKSLPAKQEYSENISLNTTSLPSYMAATESVKAKLRAQGSSKFSEDEAEPGFIRRHSLPASSNGKLSSFSPRIQKPVQTNGGKGSNKANRSMMSSRDDKALQPGWRR